MSDSKHRDPQFQTGSHEVTSLLRMAFTHPDSSARSTDIVAGVTIWAVLVPSALAYSSIVGVEPQIGLIGVPLALLGYGLFGSSPTLVVGADAAVSVLVGSAMVRVGGADDGHLALLSIMVGVIYGAMRIARMGWIADLVPRPVLKGFVQGLAIATLVGQFPALLAISVDDGVNTFDDLWKLFPALGDGLGPGAGLAVISLIALLVMSRVVPKWPTAMIVLVGSMIAVWALDLANDGVAVVGVPGSIFDSLSLSLDLSVAPDLLPAAVAIVVLGFTESLGASGLVSDQTGRRVDPNRELLGLGAANLAVGLGGSYAVTGALSKTAVAVSAGATTRLANAVVAVAAVLTALFGRPLFAYLSNGVLAAVVIWAMAGMIDLAYLRRLRSDSRVEFAVALAAFFGVLLAGVLPAVVIATLLALALLGHYVARPPIDHLGLGADGAWHDADSGVETTTPPGVRVVRFNGPLVFLNARYVSDEITRLTEEPGSVLIVDASPVTTVDTTAAHALRAAINQIGESSVMLVAAPSDRLKAAYERQTGERLRNFASLTAAVAAADSAGPNDDEQN